eukprot:10361464-Lingulodinium_polyedra.AAC.1
MGASDHRIDGPGGGPSCDPQDARLRGNHCEVAGRRPSAPRCTAGLRKGKPQPNEPRAEGPTMTA